jgi:hypothetical protein
MDVRPRFFSSKLTSTEKLVYGSLTVYFILAFLVTIWPIYTLFAGPRPFVLGLPFNLFYLAVILVVSFFVLLAVFAWEGSRTPPSREAEAPGPPGGEPAPGTAPARPGTGSA